MSKCKTRSCEKRLASNDAEYCVFCLAERNPLVGGYIPNWPEDADGGPMKKEDKPKPVSENSSQSLAQLYPKYYKPVGKLTEVDVYAVHKLFDIQDPSGAIHHASKKLLLSGVRTGGKTKFKDIKEARDTLNRWMELNPETIEEVK